MALSKKRKTPRQKQTIVHTNEAVDVEVRIPQDLGARLNRVAQASEQSFNTVVNVVLALALESAREKIQINEGSSQSAGGL